VRFYKKRGDETSNKNSCLSIDGNSRASEYNRELVESVRQQANVLEPLLPSELE
jgi:hypothetical protein